MFDFLFVKYFYVRFDKAISNFTNFEKLFLPLICRVFSTLVLAKRAILIFMFVLFV